MLEAYEIGISLALQDGVSAGINLIRQDLTTLDRAIAATSQNLAKLEAQATANIVRAPTPPMPKVSTAPALQEALPEPDPASVAMPSRVSAVSPSVPKIPLPDAVVAQQAQSQKTPNAPQPPPTPMPPRQIAPATPFAPEPVLEVFPAPDLPP